jgi:hypothetical protein
MLADLLLQIRSVSPQRKDRPATRCEVLVGRSLAACVHPLAAWRLARRVRVRLVIFAGYFAAGYAMVFAALMLLT